MNEEIKGSMGRTTGKIGDTPVNSLVMPLGMSKVPLGWPMMAQAYIDFAMWVFGKTEFLEAFKTETGITFVPPKNGLERMIDDATGAGKSFISKFLDWLTVNHWGEEKPEELPPFPREFGRKVAAIFDKT